MTPIEYQEQLNKNILSIYSNAEDLLVKSITVNEFEKEYKQETHDIFTQKHINDYKIDTVNKAVLLETKEQKQELINKALAEINSLTKVNVIGNDKIIRNFYVKEKKTVVG